MMTTFLLFAVCDCVRDRCSALPTFVVAECLVSFSKKRVTTTFLCFHWVCEIDQSVYMSYFPFLWLSAFPLVVKRQQVDMGCFNKSNFAPNDGVSVQGMTTDVHGCFSLIVSLGKIMVLTTTTSSRWETKTRFLDWIGTVKVEAAISLLLVLSPQGFF